MTDRVKFDFQDKAALRKLDSGFTIDADGEVATSAGDMRPPPQRRDTRERPAQNV